MEHQKRVIGFDLARAYAILGMYIVNFNFIFGNYYDSTWAGKFLSLFSGNSSTVFVMLAGMGVALMTNKTTYTTDEKLIIRNTINRRAWFLFVLGLLLYLWWPADILHFYGSYMHIAVWLLFLDKKYYLVAATLSIFIFHLLFFLIPYENGWNFNTLLYQDFWTINGFIRNTFYNGWNPIFPWIAYFFVGMYLGRLNWSVSMTQFIVFIIGLVLYISVLIVQSISNNFTLHEDLKLFLNADYIPPFLPFLLSTLGFGMMLIAVFMFGSKYIEHSNIAKDLAKTGQMTLTHYISHLTIGMILFSVFSGKEYVTKLNNASPISPILIFMYAIGYFAASFYFSKFWLTKYKYGPLEMLMRKLCG